MRISTLEMYTSGAATIDATQSAMAQTQEDLATGKSINVPSDNPVEASEIVQLSSASTQNSQYATNLGTAKALLAQTDSTMSSINNVLNSVRTTLVTANNGDLGTSDQQALATQLQSQLNQLVSLANTQAPDGSYLFAGYSAGSAPFTQTASGGVAYSGDQGVRAIQVSSTRDLPVTVSGDSLFQRVPTGNGVFTTGSASSNTGSGVIDTGSVTDPTQLTGDSYSVGFSVAGGATTYSLTDTTTGQTLSTGNPYTSGDAIDVAGAAVDISGAPANGDTFSIAPSTNQSVFTTIQQAITALTTPSSGSTVTVGSLATSIQNIDQAISNTSNQQTTVGTSEDELTSLTGINTSNGTALTSQISSLQSTDIAQASTTLSEQQLVLSAAEQSFAKISGDSLFNYLTT